MLPHNVILSVVVHVCMLLIAQQVSTQFLTRGFRQLYVCEKTNLVPGGFQAYFTQKPPALYTVRTLFFTATVLIDVRVLVCVDNIPCKGVVH